MLASTIAGAAFKPYRRGRVDVLDTRLGDAPGARTVLAWPRSYMNESGRSVAALRDFFKIDIDHLVLVHDELDIPFSTLRVKRGGGDNATTASAWSVPPMRSRLSSVDGLAYAQNVYNS